MYHKYLILIPFISLFSIYPINAQTKDKKCLNPPLFNVEVEKMEGNWYPQEMSNDEETRKSCVYYNFTSDKKKSNGTIFVKRNWEKNSDQFRIFQKENSSEFVAEWLGSNRRVWLLGTDYDSFALWYACFPEEHSKSTLALSTRETNPDKATLERIEDLLKAFDLKGLKKMMKRINHSTCK